MKKVKNILAVILSVSMIFAFLCTTAFALAESPTSELTLENLKEETNAVLNEDGSLSNDVSTGSPQITFLIPGFGSQASVWSNNHVDGDLSREYLAYNENSILEKLRHYSNADIYLADVTTTYENDINEFNTYGQYIDEGEKTSDLHFYLYEFPDICTIDGCDSCMFEENLDVFSRLNRKTNITDISNHIIVLFDPEDSIGSNAQIYEQFDYVADRIVYDVKTLNNGVLPKVNLIAHSRGSVTAMEYTLNHPLLVESLFTIGGVFNGSNLGNYEMVLNLLGRSNNRSDERFAYGIEDILNPAVYEDYKTRWNQNYDTLYSNVNFHAIGGAVTSGGAAYIFQNDYFNETLGTNCIGTLLKLVDVVTTIPLDSMSYADSNSGLLISDDLFIHLSSQLAEGYVGVETYTRIFTEDDIDLNMVAQANTKLPHNLETGDSLIHDYILKNIDLGSNSAADTIFNYYHTSDGTITLLGLKSDVEGSSLTIPSNIDGIQVSHIAPFAFLGESFESITIPNTVKSIGNSAFANSANLNSIVFQDVSSLEIIESSAFAGCSSLATVSLPESVTDIMNFAFYGTKVSYLTLGANVQNISANAFANTLLSGYTVSSNNLSYKTESGVLYNKAGTILVSYPCNKSGITFDISSDVETISPYAFSYATNLKSIYLGNITYVPEGAFAECTQLTEIVAPNLLLVEANSFHNTAFMDIEDEFKSIGNVLIKYSGINASIRVDYYSIAPFAFSNCTNLNNITLGNKVVNIGEFAFYNCDSLQNVYLDTHSLVYFEDLVFDITADNRKIYVSNLVIDQYKTDSRWSEYAEDFSTHQTIINFDTNGGSQIENASITYGETIGSFPTAINEGYTFCGWICNLNGELISIQPSNVWSYYNDEVTFVAQWTPAEYSIILHPDGGALDSTILYYTVEDVVTLPTPTKTGYTFKGWYESEELTGGTTSNLSVGTYGNKNYYAKWEANTYTLTLDFNYEGAPNPITVPVTYGSPFVLPIPEQLGNIFNGWKCNNSMITGESGTSHQNWYIAGDQTLYAVWTKESYYIKVNVDGTYYWIDEQKNYTSTETAIEYGTVFVSLDSLIQAFAESKIGYLVGHQTTGFNTSEALITESDLLENGNVKDLGENGTVLVLTPVYSKERFSIIFESPSNLTGVTLPTTIFAYCDDAITLGTASKTGYDFSGWRVKNSSENNKFASTEFAIGNTFSYAVMPDLSVGIESTSKSGESYQIVLEPVMTAKQIVVNFVPDNGGSLSSHILIYGVASHSFPVPSKAGYTFQGWYDGVNGTGVKYSDSTGALLRNWDKTNTTTLYAYWTIIPYTITYTMNGGTNNSANPSSYTVETTSVVFADPTKSGYRFMGWYTSSNFSSASKITQISKGSVGNKTLYAKWEYLYTITFIEGDRTYTYNEISGANITVPSILSGYEPNGFVYESTTGIIKECNSIYTVTNTNMTFTAREKNIEECRVGNTFYIYVYSQFDSVRRYAGSSSYRFELMDDIIIMGDIWIPFPDFYGTIDGNGYDFQFITINNSNNTISVSNYGLIGINRGTLTDFGISGGFIQPYDAGGASWIYVGMAAGINYGTISYVDTYNADIRTSKNTSAVGSIVGLNSGTISNCTAKLTEITSHGDIGGIAGSTSGGTISNCTSDLVDILSYEYDGDDSRSIGGIVGYASNGALIYNCTSKSLEIHFYYQDAAEVQPCIGTIVGHLDSATLSVYTEISCVIDYGNLPEKTGWIFNYHYPREYICGVGSYCGKNSNGQILR